MKLKEAFPGSSQGGGLTTWSSWSNKGYIPGPSGNKAAFQYDLPAVDKDIEQQYIDHAIDRLFNDYPELIKDKKIRRHVISMIIGKLVTGSIEDKVTLDGFIKRIKQRGIKVESNRMKIRKSDLIGIIKEVIAEETGDKSEYQNKFKKTMDKYDVDSPADLDDDEKDDFFDDVDDAHTSDKEEKNESKLVRENWLDDVVKRIVRDSKKNGHKDIQNVFNDVVEDENLYGMRKDIVNDRKYVALQIKKATGEMVNPNALEESSRIRIKKSTLRKIVEEKMTQMLSEAGSKGTFVIRQLKKPIYGFRKEVVIRGRDSKIHPIVIDLIRKFDYHNIHDQYIMDKEWHVAIHDDYAVKQILTKAGFKEDIPRG